MAAKAEDQRVKALNEDEEFCKQNDGRNDYSVLWLITPVEDAYHPKTEVKRLAQRISRSHNNELSGAIRKQLGDKREFAFECWAPKGTLVVMNNSLRRLEGFEVSQVKLDRRAEFGILVEFLGSIVKITPTPDISNPGSSGHGEELRSLSLPDSEGTKVSAAIEAINARNRESRLRREADLAEFRASQEQAGREQAEKRAQQERAAREQAERQVQELAAKNQQMAAELERLRAQAPSNAR